MATNRMEGVVNVATGSFYEVRPTGSSATWKNATMIIHDGPSEPVMLLSEHEAKVRAMLRDMEEWIENMTDGKLLLKFDTIAAKHGIPTL